MAESGLSAVIQGPQEAPDPSRIMEMFLRLKEAKQQSANREMQTAVQLADKGLIDPQHFEKVMKNWQKSTGIKLADGKTAKAMQGASKAGAQPSGAQAGSPVGAQTAKEHPAGGVETQPLEAGTPIEQYINSIRRRSMYEGLAAEKKAQVDAGINDLKLKASQGDEGARTQLMKLGEIAYNKDLDRAASLTPEQKNEEYKALHEEAMGLESPKDKLARKERYTTSLVSQGYTPEQAEKEFEKPGSSGVKKSMKQLSEEADYFYKLQESFGDETAKKIAPQLATGASLSDVLPSVGNFQSHFSQQMAETERQHKEQMKKAEEELQVRRSEVGVQKERLKFEKEMGAERIQLLSDKAELELGKLENQSFAEDFRGFLEATKAGVKMPKEVSDKFVDTLAKRVGMKREEAQGWVQWMTFGMLGSSGSTFSPDIDKGKGVLDQAGVKEKPKEERTSTGGISSFLSTLGMSGGEKKGETLGEAFKKKTTGKVVSGTGEAAIEAERAIFVHPLSTLSKIWDKVAKGLTLTEEEKQKIKEENEAYKKSVK